MITAVNLDYKNFWPYTKTYLGPCAWFDASPTGIFVLNRTFWNMDKKIQPTYNDIRKPIPSLTWLLVPTCTCCGKLCHSINRCHASRGKAGIQSKESSRGTISIAGHRNGHCGRLLQGSSSPLVRRTHCTWRSAFQCSKTKCSPHKASAMPAGAWADPCWQRAFSFFCCWAYGSCPVDLRQRC